MKILVVSEHDNSSLKDSTGKTVSAAIEIGGDIDILVAGSKCEKVAQKAGKLNSVKKVLLADNEIYKNTLAGNMEKLILPLMDKYDILLTPATTTGKNFMPRIAAKLDVAQISDIIAVKASDTFVRPIYAGNAIQTVKSEQKKQVITVRHTCFTAVQENGDGVVENIPAAESVTTCSHIKDELSQSDRPELTAAKIVISGGRGMQSKENFELLEKLAAKLGAAIGASRAAVDAGYVPNDYQVGQTGKIVAPELYIAIGISGAIQHIAGMKDSKTIVAINKDADAPIFQIADYGIVADLFEFIPEFEAALAQVGIS